ncbi:MAG TPA: hypothetical protein VHK70_11370, partial [Burkholderiaceae bacterium]|nr:hypothetical protein [Burkholderiaceae bacterium]
MFLGVVPTATAGMRGILMARSFETKQPIKAIGRDDKSFMLLAGAVSVAVLAGTVIGAFGALAALLSMVIVLAMAVALSDYRAGIVVSIFLLPLSSTHLIPRQMFGIVGMNPL